MIKTIEEIKAYQNPYITVYYDKVQFPDGSMGRYNRLVLGNSHGTVTIPVDPEGKIGLIKVYRYSIQREQWEFPAGLQEKGISLEMNAAKELQEETGLKAVYEEHLGHITPDAGTIGIVVDVFIAHINSKQTCLSGGEAIMKLEFFSTQEIIELIVKGEIVDGVTLSSFLLLQLKGAKCKQ